MMKRVVEASKPCEQCGIPMSRKRYGGTLECNLAFSRRKFCSLSCAGVRKRLTKHGYSWRARKHLKASCEACGERRQLHAHHIDQDITNNPPENIQTLCKWCHNFHHSTAKRLGLSIAGRMVSRKSLPEFPAEWTALKDSETPSSRKSRS